MDVSIIFVNYKTKDLTINAINSVIDKTTGIEYEIFVVDNNSQDGSIEAIENQFPNINIIKNEVNAGFGRANNLAITKAKGKYIFCLNTDTLLINNAIKVLFDYMEQEENQNIGVCGGALYNADNRPCICGGALPSITEILWKFGLRNIFPRAYKKYSNCTCDDYEDKAEIGYITGADIFFRKSILDKIGIFDESIFMYYEEADLCKRIKDAGYNIKINKDAKIVHLEGMSENISLNKKKWSKDSVFIYFRKHHKNQIVIMKYLYLLLYLIDYLFTRNNDSKTMFNYVWKL